jgi:hypothetical protein
MGTINWVLFFIYIAYIPFFVYKIIRGNTIERILSVFFLSINSCLMSFYVRYLLSN